MLSIRDFVLRNEWTVSKGKVLEWKLKKTLWASCLAVNQAVIHVTGAANKRATVKDQRWRPYADWVIDSSDTSALQSYLQSIRLTRQKPSQIDGEGEDKIYLKYPGFWKVRGTTSCWHYDPLPGISWTHGYGSMQHWSRLKLVRWSGDLSRDDTNLRLHFKT